MNKLTSKALKPPFQNFPGCRILIWSSTRGYGLGKLQRGSCDWFKPIMAAAARFRSERVTCVSLIRGRQRSYIPLGWRPSPQEVLKALCGGTSWTMRGAPSTFLQTRRTAGRTGTLTMSLNNRLCLEPS